MFRIAACLALAAPACSLAQGVAFFPKDPGPDDPIYLTYADRCNVSPPIGRPTLARVDSTGGWRFDLTRKEVTVGNCDLPTAAGTTFAFRIPRSSNGYEVGTVEVVERLLRPDGSEARIFKYSLPRPRGSEFPASVSGTWTLDGASAQGLLIAMDPARRIAVGFTTFDAAGTSSWSTGMAGSDASRIAVALMEVPAGRFADTLANAEPARAWGELDLTYESCGRMQGAWRPLARTGLASGVGTFRQLTSAYAYECDLAAHAVRDRSVLVEVDYAILE